jgi:hypothetical protein
MEKISHPKAADNPLYDFLQSQGLQPSRIEIGDVWLRFFFENERIILQWVKVHEVLDIYFFQNQSDYFSKENIKIIHIWEDVWFRKLAVVQSRILALFQRSRRIHGRLCEVRRIDKATVDIFLQNNHLQTLTGAKYKYGLFVKAAYHTRYADSLGAEALAQPVAVATFSTARKFVRNGQVFRSFELIRFANLSFFTVVGGLDKLLAAFVAEHQPDDLMTYADRDWSNGHGYQQLGFRHVETTVPQIFYMASQKSAHPYASQERLYTLPLPSPTDSDCDIFYKKIVNAGNLKFIKYFK